MRSYKAARREALAQPVEFKYEWTTIEPDPADGLPVEVDHETVFSCTGDISTLMLSEFANNATVDIETPEGAALVAQLFREALGDEAEYQRFFRLHNRHGDDELLMAILAGLVEDFSGRPTRRPSSSPGTRSTTGPTSRDDSSSPAAPAARPEEDNVVVLDGGFRVERPATAAS